MTIDNDGVACTPAPTCANCGAEGRVAHAGLRDRLFGAPGVWSIRRCGAAGCGLGWLDPQPLTQELGKLYLDHYTHRDSEPGGRVTYRSSGAKALLKRSLATILFWKRPVFATDLLHLQGMKPGRLLEIGCGSGEFLAAAAWEGWEPVGLDFDAQAIAAARRIPGVRAETGDLLDQDFADARFDAIVLNNVIEALPDPARIFAECRRLLAKGGRLVMITPNIDALGHETFGRHWRGLEPPRHLRLFNRATLRAFAARAGFQRLTVFSSIGRYMHEASIELAMKAGAPERAADPAALRRQGMLLNLFGRARGEWVVLVATR